MGQSHAVPHGHTHRLGHGAPTRDAATTLRPHTPVSRAKVEQEESKRAPRHFTVIACWATYMQVFGYTRYIMETNFTGFIFLFFFPVQLRGHFKPRLWPLRVCGTYAAGDGGDRGRVGAEPVSAGQRSRAGAGRACGTQPAGQRTRGQATAKGCDCVKPPAGLGA